MAFLNWGPNFSVGVAAFDREHQGLMAIINELHDKMQSGQGKEVVGAIVKRLIDYTIRHFEHEEVELKKHGYPQLRDHQAQHDALKQKVSEFHNRLTIGYNGLITIEMLRFLKSWLETHIQQEDKAYGLFLNGKGVR
jgi:hemerythrin-like metal-binding protein